MVLVAHYPPKQVLVGYTKRSGSLPPTIELLAYFQDLENLPAVDFTRCSDTVFIVEKRRKSNGSVQHKQLYFEIYCRAEYIAQHNYTDTQTHVGTAKLIFIGCSDSPSDSTRNPNTIRRLKPVTTFQFRYHQHGIYWAQNELTRHVLYRLHFSLPNLANNANPTFTYTS